MVGLISGQLVEFDKEGLNGTKDQSDLCTEYHAVGHVAVRVERTTTLDVWTGIVQEPWLQHTSIILLGAARASLC